MKPEAYDAYAPIFDAFSQPSLFPQMVEFAQNVASMTPKNGRLLDIGAGTGLFTQQIADLCEPEEIVFVEPSKPMIERAKERLQQHRVRFINEQAGSAVTSLADRFDTVTMMRSLYCLFEDSNSYRQFADELSQRIVTGGVLAIYDPTMPYDIRRMYSYYFANRQNMGLSMKEFDDGWEVMRDVFLRFNENAAKGIFTLFDEEKIRALFEPVGFALESAATGTYFMRRR